MDITLDRPAPLTADSPAATATPSSRRRRATRPTGPPVGSADQPSVEKHIHATQSTTEKSTEPIPPQHRPIRLPRFSRLGLRRTIFRIVAVAVAVIALAAACTVAVLAQRDHERTQAMAQHQAAVIDTARRAVTDLINIDKGSATADFARLTAIATPPFTDEIHNQSIDFVKTVQDANVLSSGQVLAAGIATDNGAAAPIDGSITVIVAADAKVTNAQNQQQQPRAYRFSVRVKQIGGALKVSDVEFVP